MISEETEDMAKQLWKTVPTDQKALDLPKKFQRLQQHQQLIAKLTECLWSGDLWSSCWT